MNPSETIGKAILNLRLKKKISMCQVASCADVSKGHMSMIENGIRQNVTLDTVSRIAIALGTTPSKLVAAAEKLTTQTAK